MIPSHEPAGVIAQVGDEAAHSWKIGDRVGVLNFKNTCSRCPDCISTLKRTGALDARFCRQRVTAGFYHDGAFAEYIVADSATTVALPESVSFEQAAPLLCAGVCLIRVYSSDKQLMSRPLCTELFRKPLLSCDMAI